MKNTASDSLPCIQFCLTEMHVGQSRACATAAWLADLNADVCVTVLEVGEAAVISEDALRPFQV